MKPERSETGISAQLLTQLGAAADLSDSQIDIDDPDAPEATDWSNATRGQFYKPIKKLKSLRLDADVLAFFQAQGKGYQTQINRILRAAMLRSLKAEQAEQKETG